MTAQRTKDTHARHAINNAQKLAGKGWSLLGAELREGLVARELVYMLLGQADETLAANPALARFVESARQAMNEVTA